MDYTAAPLEKLIEEFGKFQGVGRKGATPEEQRQIAEQKGQCGPAETGDHGLTPPVPD